MKLNYISFIVIGLLLSLAACKKDPNSIVGKWQQNKLRVYVISASGTITSDTTFAGATFSSQDFIQFNSNNTCSASSSHLYYPAGLNYPANPEVYATQITFDYTSAGANYVLSPAGNFINPGGFVTTDTATVVNTHNLLLHVSDYGHSTKMGATVYDSYYTR